MNKKRLGRGLSALLGSELGGMEPAALENAELLHLAVDLIDPNPFQPRRTFESAEIAALADSIRQHGMLQPILVRPRGDRYQLIAGERRLRASVEARLHEIPARVMDLDDQRDQRAGHGREPPARGPRGPGEGPRLQVRYLDSYGGTQEELAGRLGLDRSTLSNLLRLLDLPAEIHDALRNEEDHARDTPAPFSASKAHDNAGAGRASEIIAEALSVRQTEALVADGRADSRIEVAGPQGPRPAGIDARRRQGAACPGDWKGIPEAIASAPNVLVKRQGPATAGKIVIDFTSREQFDHASAALIRGHQHEPWRN